MQRLTILLTLIILFGCKESRQHITDPRDYSAYIDAANLPANKKLHSLDEELAFWYQKLKNNPGDIASESKIAGLLTRRFTYSGNISEISEADSLYKLVNTLNRINSSGTYRSLAANCITQHKFRQAKYYLDSALSLGDDKYQTLLRIFDVEMELGDYYSAEKILHQLGDKNSFEYLIRLSKFEDHANGSLDKAIALTEKAVEKIKDNEGLYCWANSNLGDLYSHANKFEKAYRCYLDVLKKDPEYYHCLKGIAWLAFSHDKDTKAARKVISFLQSRHPVPDYELLLSQVSAFEGKLRERDAHLAAYKKRLADPQYGDMYNKYNYNIEADVRGNTGAAFKIAATEVSNRPTGESYSLLSWAFYKSGDAKEALRIAKTYVEHRCFEPDAMYRLGMIYKANGEKQKAKEYLRLAKRSSYELGPVTAKAIEESLKDI